MSVSIDQHVGAAKTIGLGVLLACYVMIELALTSLSSDLTLARTREELTRSMAMSFLLEEDRLGKLEDIAMAHDGEVSEQGTGDELGVGTVHLVLHAWPGTPGGWKGDSQAVPIGDADHFVEGSVGVEVSREDGTRWDSRIELNRLPLATLTATWDGPEEAMRRLAIDRGLTVREGQPIGLVYRDLEHQLLDRKVAVPGTGLQFGQRVAAWVLVGSITFFLIALAHHTRRALSKNVDALTVPWMLLDYQGGLDALVGRAWLLLLWLMPALAASANILIHASALRAAGSISSLPADFASFALCLAVLAVIMRCSVATIGALIELRGRMMATAMNAD